MLKEAFLSLKATYIASNQVSLYPFDVLATRHHGSLPLSDTKALPANREALRLEDVIGDCFMAQIKPFWDHPETLNLSFSYHCIGILLWTYGEHETTDWSKDKL